jgi:hypothetical protein
MGLAVIGTFGSLALIVAAAQSGSPLNPAEIFKSLSSVREASYAAANSGSDRGAFGFVGSFIAPCGYLALILSVRVEINRWLLAINSVLIIYVAFVYFGGRQTIIIAALFVVAACWLRNIKMIRMSGRSLVMVILGLSAAWYFVTTFSGQRQATGDTIAKMHSSGRAAFGSWIPTDLQRNRGFQSTMLQFSYFSTPMPSLAFYRDSPDVPQPLLGSYSFPFFLGVINGPLGILAVPWSEARTQVLAPFSDRHYLNNAWATGVRDVIADFGVKGAVVFYAILGAIMGWARRRHETTGDPFAHAIETYGAVIFGFGAFQSLLYTDYTTYGLFIALVVTLIARPALTQRLAAAPAASRLARTNIA